MKRISLYVATALAGAIALVGAHTTPATAAGGNDPCPISPNGAGNVLKDQVEHGVLVNGIAENVPVLKEGVVANIVCVGLPSYGLAFINEDWTVWYGSGVFAPSVLGIDTFRVGAVQGGQYFTTEITMRSFVVDLPKPIVVRKATIKKGKVVKAAIVRFTNPTTDYNEQIRVGDFDKPPSSDIVHWASPSNYTDIKTRELVPDFMLSVTVSDPKVGDVASQYMGTIDTRTGEVTMIGLWSESNEYRSTAPSYKDARSN